MKIGKLWAALKPYVIKTIDAKLSSGGGSGSGYAPSPHDLSGAHHSGNLTPTLISPQGAGSGLDADMLDGTHASGFAAAARQIIAGQGLTGGGTLSADVTIDANVGNGLTINTSLDRIEVDVGDGLVINANGLSLDVPGTLSATSTNNASGNHTHAVQASSNPGASESLLKTDAAGGLTLDNLTVSNDLRVGTNVLFVDVSQQNVGINTNPDPQFDLDVAGNLRAQGWIVGKHAIQLDGATAIFHFDGARPYETDFTGDTRSHRGHAPVQESAIIFRPGKFGKAVQIAPAATNYIKNPSFEVDTSYWGIGSSDGSATMTRDNSRAVFGNYSLKLNRGTASWAFIYSDPSAGGTLVLANGETATASAYVYVQSGSVDLRIYTYSTLLASVTSTKVGEWERLTVTYTNNSGSSQFIHVRIVFNNTGQDFWVDAFQLEKTAYVTPYLDGSLGDGHSWSGTAHASTSNRSAARLTIPAQGVISAQKGTVACWICNIDGTGVSGLTQPGIWRWWDAWNTESMYVNFDNTKSSISFTSYAGGTNSGTISANINWNDGEWHHVVATWDATTGTKKLYIDGQLAATGSFTAPNITNNEIWIGEQVSGQLLNGWIDDFVILDRALTEDEVRAIYESNAPVFAETSTWSWRTPNNLAWADSEGLWAVDDQGNAAFGVSGVDNKSWGGITLNKGDILLGGGTSYVLWDADQAKLTVKGEIQADSGSINGTLSVASGGKLSVATGGRIEWGGGNIFGDDSGLHLTCYTYISGNIIYFEDYVGQPILKIFAYDNGSAPDNIYIDADPRGKNNYFEINAGSIKLKGDISTNNGTLWQYIPLGDAVKSTNPAYPLWGQSLASGSHTYDAKSWGSSGTISIGTKAVFMHIIIKAPAAGRYVSVRSVGSTTPQWTVYAQVANQYISAAGIVELASGEQFTLDTDGVDEIYVSISAKWV